MLFMFFMLFYLKQTNQITFLLPTCQKEKHKLINIAYFIFLSVLFFFLLIESEFSTDFLVLC